MVGWFSGASEGIRTPDLQITKLALYLTELHPPPLRSTPLSRKERGAFMIMVLGANNTNRFSNAARRGYCMLVAKTQQSRRIIISRKIRRQLNVCKRKASHPASAAQVASPPPVLRSVVR